MIDTEERPNIFTRLALRLGFGGSGGGTPSDALLTESDDALMTETNDFLLKE